MVAALVWRFSRFGGELRPVCSSTLSGPIFRDSVTGVVVSACCQWQRLPSRPGPAESASTLPDKTAAPFWKLFISPHTEISASTGITPHLVLIPQSTSWRGGPINLGQPSVRFLPLSELFVSAAESFITKGSWFAGATALFLRLFGPVDALKGDFVMESLRGRAAP